MTQSQPTGLAVRQVSVRYPASEAGPAVTAVNEVSLDLECGQTLVLLGPSGCGKSSLLRAIVGLEPLAGGRILWDGEDISTTPVHQRGFGLMFQDGQLFAHRSVGANIAFGLQMQGMRPGLRRERVAELLDLVGLAGYADRQVTALSGGERQRVALARALAPAPRLLLLDEPLSALDRSLREHLAQLLREILQSTGTTAVMVTHDHDEAAVVGDLVGVMDQGVIAQLGTVEQLWHAPASAKVAQFLGYQVSSPDAASSVDPADSWVGVPPASVRPWAPLVGPTTTGAP